MIIILTIQSSGLNRSDSTVLQKKKKWSVAEARPADSGSYRLTKQESAGRFPWINSYARDIPV